MSLGALLTDSMDVYKAVETAGTSSQSTIAWTATTVNVPCFLQPVVTPFNVDLLQYQGRELAKVYFEQGTGLEANRTRLVINSTTYEVRSVSKSPKTGWPSMATVEEVPA